MVCSTLEPGEAQGGQAGNVTTASRPITVLAVCVAATYSYIIGEVCVRLRRRFGAEV